MKHLAWTAALLVGAMAGAITARQSAPPPLPGSPLPPNELSQTVDKYCSSCHNSRTPSSAATANGMILNGAVLAEAASHPELWEKVVRKLRLGAMPPDGMPKPDAAAHDALVTWLEGTLDRAAVASPNPGRPAIHRLNRAEYANAIRDLLALDVDASTLLPPDDSASGFDNNADILGVSPALLERYVTAAARISALAVGSPKISAGSSTYRVKGDASQTMHQEGLPLGTRGGVLDKGGRTPLDVAMGVAPVVPATPAGRGGRGGRAAGPDPAAQPVSESTIALLRELMTKQESGNRNQ